MRQALRSAGVVALGLTIFISANAQNVREPHLITVSGDAEIKVAPDEANLSLGVETRDKDLKIAKAQNDGAIKRVLGFATSYGIDARDIQTDYISIRPYYKSESRVLDYYVVEKKIAIRLRDVSRFDGLLSGAIDAGANQVDSIQFHTTELRKYRDQARAMAVRAAQEKAIAMAKELGQNIGKAHAISEDYYNSYYRYQPNAQNAVQNMDGSAPADNGSIAVGQITVSARVTISFELE